MDKTHVAYSLKKTHVLVQYRSLSLVMITSAHLEHILSTFEHKSISGHINSILSGFKRRIFTLHVNEFRRFVHAIFDTT